MSPRAPSPPPRASICTAGARKDCFNGVLPAAGLGVVPTKQSIAEQARAKSTQASTREAERAMLQVLPHRELHRSGLQRGQAEAKIIAESDVNTNSIGTTHWHPCMFWIGNYQPRSPKYLTSCDAHMWSSPTNNISSCPKWDSFGWIFSSPNKHTLKPGPTARRTYQHGKHAHRLSTFVPSKTLCLPKSQGDLLCQGQQIDPSDVRILKTSISWPLPLSGLLMSSHGLKKPLMLANKDAIPSTVMPMM